jgi:CheY-like chemotaxis protein
MPARLIIMLRWAAVVVLLLAAALIIARWKLPMRQTRAQSALGYWRDVFRRMLARRRGGSERKGNLRALAGRTGLIVDPDEKSSRVMAWKLESLRCAVLKAASGRLGLAVARDSDPDFIIVDALLRDVSAAEFFRLLPRGDMPVVFVGVSGGQRDNLRAMGGNVACLGKPYDPEEAAAHAGMMLRRGRDSEDRRSRYAG